MRIATGGIHIESCTFSPLRVCEEDFTIRRGEEVRARCPFLARHPGVDLVPLLHARALPGGSVRSATYASLKREFLARLEQALPVDGFYYDIHGAMNVEGMDDAEADLAEAIRSLIGPEALMAASMDLHGNVSARLVEAVDIFTAYRTAPHLDVEETRAKAFRLLVQCLEAKIRPVRAWVPVPVILPGERTSTIAEPGRSFYRSIGEFDFVPGILDASFWVGYVWADEPRSSATTVVTGTDASAAGRTAEELARRYWNLRDDFSFGVDTGTAGECIAKALASRERLVVISDSGDNPTGGGAGDVPAMLEALLGDEALRQSGARALFASMPGKAAIDACFTAGEMGTVTCRTGGELDPVHGHPIEMRGTVRKLHVGDSHARRQSVLECGHVTVILTESRKPFHHIRDFTDLGLDLAEFKILSVKVGYLVPELEQVAGLALLALTPGAVDQDIASLPYRRVQRPVYPLDPEFAWTPRARIFGTESRSL